MTAKVGPFFGLLVLLLGAPALVAAQIPGTPTDTAQAVSEPTQETRISPRGAFLRAMAVPGWGHAAIGSFTRGGFYFVAETASAWMLVRTRARLNAAERVQDLRRAELIDRLTADGETDLEELARALAADSTISAAGSLVEARSQQFEDWLVLGIFLAFFSGADAFVSAHLRDFPGPVGVEVSPFQSGLELQLRLPLSLPRWRASPTHGPELFQPAQSSRRGG